VKKLRLELKAEPPKELGYKDTRQVEATGREEKKCFCLLALLLRVGKHFRHVYINKDISQVNQLCNIFLGSQGKILISVFTKSVL